jgi:hypothetical protein
MPEFVTVRLGKDSVSDITKIDSIHGAPSTAVKLTVTCTQVPLSVGPGFYAFLYLGSDNSKGLPTRWVQGLRALGKIVSKTGGEKYADKCEVGVEVNVIFPESISKEDFLQKAPNVYYGFSGMPVIGLSSYSNQTVQQIKLTDSTQNIGDLFQAIEIVHPDFRLQIEESYPELSNLLSSTPPSAPENSSATEYIQDVIQKQKIEGLEADTARAGWGDYPLDSVFVRKDQRTVSEIMGRMEKGRYILDPDFQRDFVWSPVKQSRLIESCLMRIPLPVFYVAEAKDGKIIVVDGLQRLTTFQRYINNKFALTGLGDGRDEKIQDNPLLGKKYENLPLNLQERLEDTQLTLYILDSKAPERAKLDIFERVNGGVPLTRQQMRNCLFNGQATNWLKGAAASNSFLNATGGSLDKKSMRDREAINRFCAFRLVGVERYKGDMDDFLARTLDEMNSLSKTELESLTEEFDQAMKANYMLFGKHAFRKSLAENSPLASRTVINIALFDVCSVLFATLEEAATTKHADQLRNSISALIKDETFSQAITYGTNGVPQVTTRFKMMKKAIGVVT